MADYQSERTTKMKKTKKRKLSTSSGEEFYPQPAKSSRIDISEPESIAPLESRAEADNTETSLHLRDDPPWRNLQLIISLQNKDISPSMKVELAFHYVKTRTSEGAEGSSQESESVSLPRVLVFLNNWVQTVMILSVKTISSEGNKNQLETAASCLDDRCWQVFRFCLEESKKLHVALSFSRDFLRVIQCISRDVLSRLNAASLCKESVLSGEEFEFYSMVLDCISLVFTSHGGISNENLDLWVSVINTVLELIQKIFTFKLEHTKTGIFVLQLSYYVHEPFAKFLRVHPTRKNGFRDFVDKLLEPMLLLWDLLHLHTCKSSPHLIRDLLKLIEEVLSHGLFHPMHIEGFFDLQSTARYKTLDHKDMEIQKAVIKSYHRHFFDALEKTISRKNASAVGGLGVLLGLFISCISKNRGLSVGKDGYTSESSSRNSLVSGKSHCTSGLNAETRKLSFDFFVQIMEYFLSEFNTYLQAELEDGDMLLDAHCKLRSANKLLFALMHARVYARTEDITEGACLNFLRLVYDRIISLSSKIISIIQTPFASDKSEVLVLIAKEVVHAVHYLLDIDYDAIGDNLERLWRTVFCFTAFSYSLMDVPDQNMLTSEIQKLGCKLVHLYNELRQVNTAIFSLCKAARDMVSFSPDRNIQTYKASFANSFSMVLCCPEFRLSIGNAIKSVPEGQASGCIRELIADISESLEWIKAASLFPDKTDQRKQIPHISGLQCFDPQIELLGRSLSEVYVLILDSLTVTTGNSSLVSISVKDLMALIGTNLSSLVSEKVNSVDDFLSVVLGRTLDKGTGSGDWVMSTHWILVFFFRIYLSCRSLQRQSISLLAPNISKKMSGKMGDSFTAYSGSEWLESTGSIEEGYFSWIIKPSASLLAVINIVSDVYLQDAVTDCSPLIYVMNVMALQRLVDLNRQIRSIDYLLLKNDNLTHSKIVDDAGLSFSCKDTRKWKMLVSDLRHEAASLTKFIMGYLKLVAKNQLYIPSSEDASSKDIFLQHAHKFEAWDLGIGSLNEKSVPSAVWWILCQNIDVWCTHASKKYLKKFMSILVHSSIPCLSNELNENKIHIKKMATTREVNISQISLEVLGNSVLYEQRFVRRNMTSILCQTLEKSVASLFSSLGDANLDSPPDWRKVVDALEDSSAMALRDKNRKNTHLLWVEAFSHLFNLPAEQSEKKSPFHKIEFTTCQTVLNLLSWIPKGYLSSKSFSRYATSILNLEWLVVGSLLGWPDSLTSFECCELLKLFVSCRRAFKYLLMESFEERREGCQSTLSHVLSDLSFPSIWLMKSLFTVIGFQNAFSEDFTSQVEHMMFSLMDHTSNVFWTLVKDQFECAILSLTSAEKHCDESPTAIEHQDSDLDEYQPPPSSPFNEDALKSIAVLAETLNEHINRSLDSLNGFLSKNKEVLAVSQELKKVSSMISCFQGFLWGLASALNDMDAEDCCLNTTLSRCKSESMFKIKSCIDRCTDFINNIVQLLLLEGDQLHQNLSSAQGPTTTLPATDIMNEGIQTFVSMNSQPIGVRGDSNYCGSGKMSPQINTDLEALLSRISTEQRCVRKPLLQALLKGENSEAAFCLRQLFIASSAVLRLNLSINHTALSWSLIPYLIQISESLLLEFASDVGVVQPFSLVCLYGVVKFLEELGKYFPLLNPSSSRNLYIKVIDLHLRALGKCICLQGKGVTLATEETESSTKMLNFRVEFDPMESHWTYNLGELKSQLRGSFRTFVGKASELHLLSVVQAIERAVVGVQEGCMVNYEVCTRISDGGMVSSNVAAGIECLNLVLESATGRKRLALVKRHIHTLVSCLINVVLHLQGRNVFCMSVDSSNCFAHPDSGYVILLCIEVLIKICAKHAFFQLEKCHITQLLRLPAAIFQNLFQLKEFPRVSTVEVIDESSRRDSSYAIYQQFLLKLYAGCCQLLCTVLKHHKSETQCGIALLDDSVSKLLHCLEMDTDSTVLGSHFIREVQDGVKCAGFLRRIYEEIRQQKDVYNRNSFQFLSAYIWVYCGYGPQKAGIRREIDEALRPGIFALIDICSTEDLQYLHTVFGEGPCRSVLASLQQDYKLNFQYEGKV
ncbi:PREDICTED: uncharacterized protein LOC109165139 isoform X1 [Ipomoea nil]|uniref:uncharacterized protein LOC109165139 isoform X1 n=2 Tax=Ipomoea nil TaxID=35883 RepID=UPI000901C777|nr:PREDICTED: uncharacterized protein LOC109165139 isoform X1 [Ipomoea nil]